MEGQSLYTGHGGTQFTTFLLWRKASSFWIPVSAPYLDEEFIQQKLPQDRDWDDRAKEAESALLEKHSGWLTVLWGSYHATLRERVRILLCSHHLLLMLVVTGSNWLKLHTALNACYFLHVMVLLINTTASYHRCSSSLSQHHNITVPQNHKLWKVDVSNHANLRSISNYSREM